MKFALSKKLFSRKRTPDTFSRGEHEYMNPALHWMYGLSAAILTLCAGITFIAYDFYDQLGTTEIDFVPEEQPAMYRDKEVIYISNMYSDKETTFNALRQMEVVPVVSEVVPVIDDVDPPTDVTTSETETNETPLAESFVEQ